MLGSWTGPGAHMEVSLSSTDQRPCSMFGCLTIELLKFVPFSLNVHIFMMRLGLLLVILLPVTVYLLSQAINIKTVNKHHQ